jgi:hypothetical protein
LGVVQRKTFEFRIMFPFQVGLVNHMVACVLSPHFYIVCSKFLNNFAKKKIKEDEVIKSFVYCFNDSLPSSHSNIGMCIWFIFPSGANTSAPLWSLSLSTSLGECLIIHRRMRNWDQNDMHSTPRAERNLNITLFVG